MSTSPSPTELIFLGTGTSSAVPSIHCLTESTPTCPTCTSPLPQNKRLNTSCLIRIGAKNLVIDCGKTFYTSAIKWFPEYKLRRIDAILLTHPHSDAINGLDDARGWTLGACIQPWIDIYCSQLTMNEISRAFPYLVHKGEATGGGDVPEFRWHVFDEEKSFTIPECSGVEVTPLPVEHGFNFKTGAPFPCLGFRVGGFSYISDCSAILARTTDLIRGSEVLVIDGLHWGGHASHFSIYEARDYARDEFEDEDRPKMIWLTGFSHRVEHVHATKECAQWTEREGRGVRVAPAWDGLRIDPQGRPLEPPQHQNGNMLSSSKA